MIGIITVGEQAMADRYAYLPFIGLFVAVVWTLTEAASKRRISSTWCAGGAVVALFILGCLTYRQITYWRNSETLWRYTLSVSDRNYTAHNNLALTLLEQGRDDEAVVEFRAGKAQHHYPPDQVLALGFYELRVGRHPREAIEDCTGVLHESNDLKVQTIAYS